MSEDRTRTITERGAISVISRFFVDAHISRPIDAVDEAEELVDYLRESGYVFRDEFPA